MADEGKKVSFGFSKSIKKSSLKVLPQVEEKKVDYIECLDAKAIKVVGGEEKKDEVLVIPMLGSRTWHDRIVNKTDADIFEQKTTKENRTVKIENGNASTTKNAGEPMDVSEIKKEVPEETEEAPKTLEEQAADEIIEDLKSNVVKVEDHNLAVPMPEADSLHGTQQNMARCYNLRNAAAVSESLTRKEREQALDFPSEDEDTEERFSGSESEENEQALDFPSEDEDTEERSSGSESEENADKKFSAQAQLESEHSDVNEPLSKRIKRETSSSRDSERSSSERRQSLSQEETAIINLPGPIGDAKEARSPLDAWNLLFSESMLEKIVLHTNQEICRYLETNEIDNESTNHAYINISVVELKALIGLLYFSGLQKASKTNLEDLWSAEFGSILYRATMTRNRFWFLTRNIRFDDKTTREERRATDNFAPIRELWQSFISNCTKYYNPNSHCTIDEQLVPLCGRCPFKVYGGPPNRSGMQIVMLNDATTFYMYTAEPDVGTVKTEIGEGVTSYYIRKLSEPLHGTGRNITCDNWSLMILAKMVAEEHSTTMVDTPRKNKKTKGGSNTFDQLCREYSTARKTLRWPMRMWMAMLDQAGINAMILHNFNSDLENLNRRTFIKTLVKSLIEPHLRERLIIPSLRRDLRVYIQTIVQEEPVAVPQDFTRVPQDVIKKPTRCSFCPRARDRKVRVFCQRCYCAVCENHRTVHCNNCATVD